MVQVLRTQVLYKQPIMLTMQHSSKSFFLLQYKTIQIHPPYPSSPYSHNTNTYIHTFNPPLKSSYEKNCQRIPSPSHPTQSQGGFSLTAAQPPHQTHTPGPIPSPSPLSSIHIALLTSCSPPAKPALLSHACPDPWRIQHPVSASPITRIRKIRTLNDRRASQEMYKEKRD